MDADTGRVLRKIEAAWADMRGSISRMYQAADIKPSDVHRVFVPLQDAGDGLIKFNVGPVVFNMPERASGSSPDLFVVVQGVIAFDRAGFAKTKNLSTRGFSTRVGYFRSAKQKLQHVYGAHYDFSADEVGHPIFHAQMRSFSQMAEHVAREFFLNCDVEDHVAGLLRNVRVPCAQMDPFSLFLQLCADHLLHAQSGPEVKEAFEQISASNAFFKGAAGDFIRLKNEPAISCYRARHWYPSC